MIIFIKSIIGVTILFLVLKISYGLYQENKKSILISPKKWNNKIQKMRLLQTMSYYVSCLPYCSFLQGKVYSPFILLGISVLFSILCFIITYVLIPLVSTALIVSIFSFFIPYHILKYLYDLHRQRILHMFPTYAISLKNNTIVHNDIVLAMKKVKAEKPLSLYIEKCNIAIEKGIKIYDCFEMLKQDIGIAKISEFFTAVQNCYLKGGDFSKLLETYARMLSKMNIQKEKEKEASFSSKLVLVILISINIYLLFVFVLHQEAYRVIMMQRLIGKIIININVFSYVVIFWFMKKLNRWEAF